MLIDSRRMSQCYLGLIKRLTARLTVKESDRLALFIGSDANSDVTDSYPL